MLCLFSVLDTGLKQRLKSKKKNSMEVMVKALAAEKAKTELLTKKLKRSKKENEELSASIRNLPVAEVCSTESTALPFERGHGLSSTRNTVAPSSQEESRFLTSMNQLSVASVNVPECTSSDNEDIHRHNFEQWKDLLIDSMKLAGIEDEQTMFIVFKVKAGIRLLEIFRNTKTQNDDPDQETMPFSNAIHRLKSYFGSSSDIMLMRRRLALMAQNDNETDLAFITRVGSTARLCEFDRDKEFEEIVATVAEHARNKDVRTTALKMLSRKGSFTDLVDKVREIEAIRLNEEFVMRKRGNSNASLVAAVTAPYPRNMNRQQRFPERYSERGGPYQRTNHFSRQGWRAPRGRYPRGSDISRSSTTVKCWRCNTIYHSADDCNCKDKVCNNCGKIGHIRRACKSLSGQIPKRVVAEAMQDTPKEIAAIEKMEGSSAEDETVSDVVEN